MNHVLAAQRTVKGVMASCDVVAGAAWYLGVNVPLANCRAAYQPIQAASQSAGNINIAHPGTNDATPHNSPGWDTSYGWLLNGISQYFDTGLVVSPSWSVVIRFIDVTLTNDRRLFGDSVSGAQFSFMPQWYPNNKAYINGDPGVGKINNTTPTLTSGVIAICGNRCYINGVPDGVIPSPSGTHILPIHIGAANALQHCAGKIPAFAIYDITLSDENAVKIMTDAAAL